jgi:hypothetical protein
VVARSCWRLSHDSSGALEEAHPHLTGLISHTNRCHGGRLQSHSAKSVGLGPDVDIRCSADQTAWPPVPRPGLSRHHAAVDGPPICRVGSHPGPAASSWPVNPPGAWHPSGRAGLAGSRTREEVPVGSWSSSSTWSSSTYYLPRLGLSRVKSSSSAEPPQGLARCTMRSTTRRSAVRTGRPSSAASRG